MNIRPSSKRHFFIIDLFCLVFKCYFSILRTSYWLDANAKCIMKTEKLIVSSNVMGTKHSKSTTNMSRALNKVRLF